jgi:glutathione S-transferase
MATDASRHCLIALDKKPREFLLAGFIRQPREETMAMKIYGSPMSRASRSIWCAKELGVPFEHVDLGWDQLKSPDFLAVNPNGKFPGFADGDLKLFESLAINLYIAKKYGTGELYPTNIEDEARTFQWTLWAATEVEPLVLPSVMVKFGFGSDPATAKACAERVKPVLKVLDDYLQTHEWLVGKNFSVADLNAASVVGMARYGDIDISYVPNVSAWLDRCLSRPARNPKARE